MRRIKKIDVLGSIYTIYRVKSGENAYMDKMHFGGMCNALDRKIHILDLSTVDDWKDDTDEIRNAQEMCTLRHEIIHAFLNESGLQWNSLTSDSAWAKNEEMVDWIAIQFPKILKVFNDVRCI